MSAKIKFTMFESENAEDRICNAIQNEFDNSYPAAFNVDEDLDKGEIAATYEVSVTVKRLRGKDND